MSLTPEILAALRDGYVPADVIGGLLGNGWCGPGVLVDGDGRYSAHEGRAAAPVVVLGPEDIGADARIEVYDDGVAGRRRVARGRLLLPLARPEVRLRVAAVLAAGEPCSHTNVEIWTYRANMSGHEFRRCSRCGADPTVQGYLRKPAPCWHLLPAAEIGPGGLQPELAPHAPELVGCHVALVLDGKPGIVGLLEEWGRSDFTPGIVRWSRRPLVGDALAYARDVLPEGNRVAWGFRSHPSHTTASGPETGDAGRACADAAALRAGYALRDATGLRAPWPEVA